MEEIKLLVLRLTERCNLRCAYCYAARDNEPDFEMNEQTALRAVELCCPPGGSLRIQFTGGEPLLKLGLKEAVAAFGDDANDTDMLRECGCGVAMGNALPQVKAAANAVTAANTQHGVAKWIEEHILA